MSNKEKKYFPIATDSACKLKWTWSTIFLSRGETRSCYRVPGGTLSASNFESFHNTPKKIADRELMLKGIWPQGGCEYCKNIEDAGGHSDRNNHQNIPGYIPDELSYDHTAVNVQPKILEVYFSNACNMSCVYCTDELSSQWQAENNKYGEFKQNLIHIKPLDYDQKDVIQDLEPAFFSWLEKSGSSLDRLNVLGGEPFYQKQFYKLLDFLEQHPLPNLELNPVSNLKINSDKLQTINERIAKLLEKKHIKRYDLTMSVDCYGEQQEYVRSGMDFAQWKTNFELCMQDSNIFPMINGVVSTLTLDTLPDLYRYTQSVDNQNRLLYYFSRVSGSRNYVKVQDPVIFGPGHFDKAFVKVLNSMPTHGWQHSQAKQHMTGLMKYCQSGKKDIEKISGLKIYLDEIDRRRSTNWRSLWPWLEEEFDKCGIIR